MASHEHLDRLSLRHMHHELRRVPFGEFEFRIGPEMTIPERVKIAFEQFLNTEFTPAHLASQIHRTPFQDRTGLPSPIVRVDASSIVDINDPKHSIFEVEARPAGLGILTRIFGVIDPIRDVFNRVSNIMQAPVGCGALPSVLGVTGSRDRSIDTQLFAQSINIPYLYRPWRLN